MCVRSIDDIPVVLLLFDSHFLLIDPPPPSLSPTLRSPSLPYLYLSLSSTSYIFWVSLSSGDEVSKSGERCYRKNTLLHEIETTTVSCCYNRYCKIHTTSPYAGHSDKMIGKHPLRRPTLYTQRTDTNPVCSRLLTLLSVTGSLQVIYLVMYRYIHVIFVFRYIVLGCEDMMLDDERW